MSSLPATTVVLIALAGATTAHAAAECSFRVEAGAAAAAPLSRQLRVGEVDRVLPDRAARFVNDGPHDIRITFDSLAPRVLQRGQSEPRSGRLADDVRARSVECLPSRASAHRVGTLPASPSPRHPFSNQGNRS